ncbi:metal ABC transporter substrate-binding protein [Clostridium sp. HMP27]|uniref:metal ABC transporter substrate-binding protein n=1 Tax=Clostridium sp. HMP27 TaxID=1487921 RepID=UPI00052D0055|nr:metal ABC transporter substrate-binding protein [Clostridium sp. HMP27]KGK82170.1 ABC transporter substrate-binding protein [Clostridium sp. HMP27]
MKKKLLYLITVILLIMSLVACNKNTDTKQTTKIESNGNEKIKIAVTFNPLKEFAEAVGGDKVQVETIIPNGSEPHDFDPRAKDLINIENADIFVYNGLNMEPWVDKVISNLQNKDLVKVESSKNVKAIEVEEHESEEDQEHGDYDPHTWLGLTSAKVQAKNITDALIKIDEKNKDFYEKNYKQFEGELDKLLNEYQPKFQALKNKNFVTGHAAFAYFCRDFGLKQNSVEGVFAEGEPTPKKLKTLTDYCKENKVKTIFVEEMVSPKVSETLAKEVGADIKTIYTVESSEDNKSYIQSMESNIKEVYESLK